MYIVIYCYGSSVSETLFHLGNALQGGGGARHALMLVSGIEPGNPERNEGVPREGASSAAQGSPVETRTLELPFTAGLKPRCERGTEGAASSSNQGSLVETCKARGERGTDWACLFTPF